MIKTEQITFRISEQLKAQITLRAIQENRTVADYVRWVVQKDIKENLNKKED